MENLYLREKLSELKDAFGLRGNITDAVILGGGLVNDTFRADIDGECAGSYVFQRVSSYAYSDPRGIMDNIAAVQRHLETKGRRDLPSYLAKPDGGNCHVGEDGECWRIMPYIPSVYFTKIPDDLKRQGYEAEVELKIVAGAGRAFGALSEALSDMDPSLLKETIPGFHDTPARIASMLKTADTLGVRCDETEFIRGAAKKAAAVCGLREKGLIPVRPVHNDTKLSNVLFDRASLEPLAVIDLDTLMPGLAVYDFADCARSVCKIYEDGRLRFSEERYGVLEKAWLDAAGSSMSSAERDVLRLTTWSVSIELAARYLEDHMRGSRYFRTSYPGQNLDKARELIYYAQTMNA